MNKFIAYLLFLIPGITCGQLFPNLPVMKGSVEKIVEKGYGKEEVNSKKSGGIFHSRTFSGWKYTYLFDKNSNLLKRTNTFQGKIKADYLYQRETIENRRIEREIVTDNQKGNAGDYIEYENFTDSVGRVVKVNFWAFDARKHTFEIFQVDQNAEYRGNQLTSFTRHLVSAEGDFSDGETCSFFYNPSGQLIRIERKDHSSDFMTVINYSYNNRGLISNCSIDFLVEIQEYKKSQIQKISFKYDRQGNWTRKYLKSGDKNILEAKRKIKYQ